ncbi:MAG: arylsulfatase [Pirellula sp.]|jgi:arylsulfatase A-like enzyme
MVILCDDLGFSDIGVYGSEINTPNLDRLAKNGARFHQFYNTARCWPTRAALLTGYYAQQVRRDTVEGIPSGAQAKRPSWAKLLPERLKKYGYRSYHSGKWHVDGSPLAGGFDHSYSLQDHDRHFNPKNHTLDDKPLPPVKEGGEYYYSSTAIAQYAIDQLNDHQQSFPDKPFFSFIAFTAPHFPLHAPQPIVDRYRSKYQDGWEAVRQRRWESMKDFGIASQPSSVERSVGPPYPFPDAIKKLGPGELNLPKPWNELNEEQKRFQIDKMAVHAAMIDCMDQEIGRIIDWLSNQRKLDDTLILFLSDNGASAEIMVRGDGHNPQAPAGSPATFLSLGPGWSTVSNTPFRRHKTWVHEGGISTPMIAHWPASITPNPAAIATPHHVIDIAPTLLELAEGAAGKGRTGDTKFDWSGPLPAGQSFVAELTNNPKSGRDNATPVASSATERVLWWQHEGNRALRWGDWKLVAAGKNAPWELYDLKNDRIESNDQAAIRPEIVEKLAEKWEQIQSENAALAKSDETN